MMYHRPLTVNDYWLMPFAFIITVSLTVIVISWPSVYSELMAHIAEAERNKADARQYRQLWREAQPTVSAFLTPQITILSDHDRAWKHWLIRCAVESERVGGVSYQKMKGFFGGDQTKWRAYVNTLVVWDKCWPVQPRIETFLKPGITPTLIYDLLIGGDFPPALPDGPPPVLQQRQQGDESTGFNSGETDADSPVINRTAPTGYAAEH
jgi:hypothetical protein